MPLTLEERERQAYIAGRTEEAADIARALDAKEEADMDLVRDNDLLRSEVRRVEQLNADMQDENEKLGDRVKNLTDTIDRIRTEVAHA